MLYDRQSPPCAKSNFSSIAAISVVLFANAFNKVMVDNNFHRSTTITFLSSKGWRASTGYASSCCLSPIVIIKYKIL